MLFFPFCLCVSAEYTWPDYLPSIQIGNDKYEGVFYPYAYYDFDSLKCDSCVRKFGSSMHWYSDRKYKYLVSSKGELSLIGVERKNNNRRFVDVTKCLFGNKSEFFFSDYSGVAMIPLEKKRRCQYRVVKFENGYVVSDIIYDWLDFEAMIEDDSKNIKGRPSMRQRLYLHDWEYWGGYEQSK